MKVSKEHTEEFPVEQIAKIQEVIVEFSGENVLIPYKDLELVSIHGQLCLKYSYKDKELYMPLVRVSALIANL